MKTAALLREQIEDSLSARIPVALSPRVRARPEKTACGIAAIDAMLDGGLSAGVVTEFVGQEGSGRTTAALACVAAMTQEGQVCAWIDGSDALLPEAVAAKGVDLERLLWVRCGARTTDEPRASSEAVQGVVHATGTAAPGGGLSPHPRSEGRDMPEAIQTMLMAHGGLHDRQIRREAKIGTPGAANRPLTRPPLTHGNGERVEQVNSDRMPARRGDMLNLAPRCAEPQPRRVARKPSAKRLPVEPVRNHAGASSPRNPWQALDQAMRATDLLLQSGGFRAIVLDLGGMPPEMVWRIPLATWFRFRAACEQSRASLVVLTQHPCARSSAEAVVRFEHGVMEAQGRVMTGVRYRAEVERSRSYEDGGREGGGRVLSMRKPPQRERPGTWESVAAWAR